MQAVQHCVPFAVSIKSSKRREPSKCKCKSVLGKRASTCFETFTFSPTDRQKIDKRLFVRYPMTLIKFARVKQQEFVVIKYLGSKRTLLDTIEQVMSVIQRPRSVIDLFQAHLASVITLKVPAIRCFPTISTPMPMRWQPAMFKPIKSITNPRSQLSSKKWHLSNLHRATSLKTFAKTHGSFKHIMAQKWTQ